MMLIKTYDDIEIKILWHTSNPIDAVITSLNITMKKEFLHDKKTIEKKKELIKKILFMKHTNAFENVCFSFLILGASRNFLAQITRHRIGSFSSASQHYQNYNSYGAIMCESMANDSRVSEYLNTGMKLYNDLISEGIDREEARQILCGGMENNIVWTVNARSLINFFNLRLCLRNTMEMLIVANKIKKICDDIFPELFIYVGSDCKMYGQCMQKNLTCKNNILGGKNE